MGFGLVFIGYLFMYSFPYKGFDITVDLLGFLIAYFGIRKLAEYGCGFDTLKKYFYVLFPASSITLIFQLCSLFGVKIPFASLYDSAYIALVFVYNILLFVAIYKIADDTEIFSIKAKAKRNLTIGVIYYLLVFFFNLPIEYIQQLKVFLTSKFSLGLILFIVGYVWLFLNLVTIFNCYMWICEQGDEEMPIKERKLFLKRNEDE